MASKNYSVQLVNIRADGTRDNIHPITKANNVKVTPQNYVPEGATTVAKVFDALGALAFKNTEIDDEQIVTNQTWSSSKINHLISSLLERIEILEEYVIRQEGVTVDETGTILLPLVYGTVNSEREELNINTSAMSIKDGTMYT